MDTSKQEGNYNAWRFFGLLNRLGIIYSVSFSGQFDDPYDPLDFFITVKEDTLL